MKKYILTVLFGGALMTVSAQDMNEDHSALPADSIHLGYQIMLPKAVSPYSVIGLGADVFLKSPEIDVSKALYGHIAGLNVYQGTGSSATNVSSLSIHGHNPLVLVDGFPRNIEDITAAEIESCEVLKDAAASALYGVRGANGVILITTKRGSEGKLTVGASYQFGINTQFRSPEFADSHAYAAAMNTALRLDGLNEKYNNWELAAFRDGTYPEEYPNVDWWKESMNNTALNHRLTLTFNGGSNRFRYYSVVDYMHDTSFLKSDGSDKRFNASPTDVRLNLRANVDVDITSTTLFRLGIAGKLMETNGSYAVENNQESGNPMNIYNVLYQLPSAVFPIRYSDGIYGGNAIYTTGNPVAMLTDTGNMRTTYGKLLADMSLKQNLDIVLKGLSAEVSLAFDNIGSMFDASSKEYRYKDLQPAIAGDGTLKTTPLISGKDSETLGHGQDFKSLFMRSTLQGKISYVHHQGVHSLNSALIYDQQSYTSSGRNKSSKRQSALVTATYTYDNRYTLSGVMNYSGTAYLPKGERFQLYPAVSGAWIVSNEKFFGKVRSYVDHLKLFGSFGISGNDGNMSHELYLQSFSNANAGNYYFTNNASIYYGLAEGDLPVIGLTIEKSKKATYGFELNALRNRLSLYCEGFFERRSNILVSGSNTVSGIIGINVAQVNEGIQEYHGFDASLTWKDKIRDFSYSIGANVSYVDSKIINDNQAFQQYDYLYTKGNRVGQKYGLEVTGIFQNQMEINNSPVQTFSTCRPGDLKYKDQNGDNQIDEQDVVKMYGTNIPRFYFGFNLNAAYKGFELSADFQGLTGYTVNLLDSPLYKPLVNNGNISKTFLDNETPWTPENAAQATMPRLTTQSNANNYRANSMWFKDGSFIKLRNLQIAYNIPKRFTHFADIKVYLQGTNLFSLDNIGFADPEQLSAAYPSTRSYWAGLKFNF